MMLDLHGGHGSSAAPGDRGWVLFAAVVSALIGLAVLYEWWARQAPRGWSRWRTASWFAGCAVIGLALSPALADRSHPVAHMAQHLLLGMFAPLGLMLAAPGRLLLASSSQPVRRSVARILRSRPLHLVGHPVSAATLSVGGLTVVMLTPLYDALERYPLLHHAVHLHYLTAGYLFAWSIAGPDPTPRRPGLPARITVLIAAAAAHSILAKVLYAQASRLPMSHDHGTEAVQQASQLMYYGGDLAEVLLAAALFSTWFKHTSHHHRRTAARCRRTDLSATQLGH
jgi:cytochrome c oxidase assembly factor CtaG